jgi:hypothetical protein
MFSCNVAVGIYVVHMIIMLNPDVYAVRYTYVYSYTCKQVYACALLLLMPVRPHLHVYATTVVYTRSCFLATYIPTASTENASCPQSYTACQSVMYFTAAVATVLAAHCANAASIHDAASVFSASVTTAATDTSAIAAAATATAATIITATAVCHCFQAALLSRASIVKLPCKHMLHVSLTARARSQQQPDQLSSDSFSCCRKRCHYATASTLGALICSVW